MVGQKAGRAAKYAGSWVEIGSDSRIDSLRLPTRRHNKRQLPANREPTVVQDNRYLAQGSPSSGGMIFQFAGKIDITCLTCVVSANCRGQRWWRSGVFSLVDRNQHSRPSESGGTLLGSFSPRFFRKQHCVDRSAKFNKYQNDYRRRYFDRGSGTQRRRHDLCLPRRSEHAFAPGSDSPKRSYPNNFAAT